MEEAIMLGVTQYMYKSHVMEYQGKVGGGGGVAY